MNQIHSAPLADDITGLILAGGAGRRVQCRDKGLIEWHGKPLIAHVSQRLQQQVSKLIISCNRNLDAYEKFGATTVTDTRRDFQGPLAGLEAALPLIHTKYLVVVACDTPSLPEDLASRLTVALCNTADHPPNISYAHDGLRAQYLCAAMHRDCLATLGAFLDEGHRAVRDWFQLQRCVAVDFSNQASCFRNYNHID